MEHEGNGILAPALSQVPGLSETSGEENDPFSKSKKGWIRDTDSKYIQMAKSGGRKDLLMFNGPNLRSNEPVAYPRVDWFDHQEPEVQERQPLVLE